MPHYILRRRKLGRKSCKGILAQSRSDLRVIRNDQGVPDDGEIVFRWGCTSAIPSHQIVNSAEAIARVGDKLEFRRILQEHELCPETWFIPDAIQLPCIIRPRHHAQGRKLYHCRTQEDVAAALRQCGNDFYASRVIDKAAEYRVLVAQGRAVWVVRKYPGNPQDIAWNVARGGRFENIRWDAWPLKAIKTAIEAFELSGLDFGGIDVMEDKAGEMSVLEINSAPSQTSPYRQQCMARVFDYIVEHGKDTIPLVDRKGGYKKFIHPAISDAALRS